MKKSQLKQLIREVATQLNELLGDKPEIGQARWNYEVKITVTNWDGSKYDRTDVSKWAPVIAKDEQEAKKKAIEAYNLRVVKIHSVKVTKVKDIDQSDIEQYDKMAAGYAHELRPKSQGGWGADESVVKEGKEKKGQLLTENAFTISPEQKKFADEIIDAAVNKTRGREPMLQDLEAIRTVIKFKLAQEGWKKSGSSSSTPKEPWPPMPKDVRNVDPTDIKL